MVFLYIIESGGSRYDLQKLSHMTAYIQQGIVKYSLEY